MKPASVLVRSGYFCAAEAPKIGMFLPVSEHPASDFIVPVESPHLLWVA
jgi:hypothetical protein